MATDRYEFDNLDNWMAEIKDACHPKTPVVLVQTGCDLLINHRDAVKRDEFESKAEELGCD